MIRLFLISLFLSSPFALLAMETDSREENKTLRTPPVNLFEQLPDEVLINIFCYLNQKHIPNTCVNKHFYRIMNDNRLWKDYAEKAFLVMKGQKYDDGRDYKDLIKEHSLPSFTMLTGEPEEGIGNIFDIFGVSADGTNIVGQAADEMHGYQRAFRWTRQGGMEFLPGLEGQIGFSCARCISLDGLTVAGDVNDLSFPKERFPIGKQTACLWTKDGIKVLALNSGSLFNTEIVSSTASGISLDGTVIVGSITYIFHGKEKEEAFFWSTTEENGLHLLGAMSGGTYIRASGISADGSTLIIGYGDIDEETKIHRPEIAFYWTKKDGMQSLGRLNEGSVNHPWGTNFDGSLIVGNATDGSDENHSRAVRWTKEQGIEVIGPSCEGEKDTVGATAYGISFDGSRIIGCTTSYKPFLWENGKGMQFVEQVLHNRGISHSLNEWELASHFVMSASGTVLAGGGAKKRNSERIPRELAGWRAVIPKDNLF